MNITILNFIWALANAFAFGGLAAYYIWGRK